MPASEAESEGGGQPYRARIQQHPLALSSIPALKQVKDSTAVDHPPIPGFPDALWDKCTFS